MQKEGGGEDVGAVGSGVGGEVGDAFDGFWESDGEGTLWGLWV